MSAIYSYAIDMMQVKNPLLAEEIIREDKLTFRPATFRQWSSTLIPHFGEHAKQFAKGFLSNRIRMLAAFVEQAGNSVIKLVSTIGLLFIRIIYRPLIALARATELNLAPTRRLFQDLFSPRQWTLTTDLRQLSIFLRQTATSGIGVFVPVMAFGMHRSFTAVAQDEMSVTGRLADGLAVLRRQGINPVI
jgi:hypothetical protein